MVRIFTSIQLNKRCNYILKVLQLHFVQNSICKHQPFNPGLNSKQIEAGSTYLRERSLQQFEQCYIRECLLQASLHMVRIRITSMQYNCIFPNVSIQYFGCIMVGLSITLLQRFTTPWGLLPFFQQSIFYIFRFTPLKNYSTILTMSLIGLKLIPHFSKILKFLTFLTVFLIG